MSHPSIVNVKHEGFEGRTYLYIGRPMAKTFKGSIYANPFSHKSRSSMVTRVATREEAVESYRKWVTGELELHGWEERRQEIIANLPRLAMLLHGGMKLGCWCAPELCHGEVLIDLALMVPAEAVKETCGAWGVDWNKVLERDALGALAGA